MQLASFGDYIHATPTYNEPVDYGQRNFGWFVASARCHGVGCQKYTCAGPNQFSATECARRRFRSMFNPAPRSMGLIQRTSYFDDLLRTRGRLEVALVIDGTDSMGEQLAGIQSQMAGLVGDLRRVVGNQLAVQMLIYRDVGAKSGTISWPLKVDKQSWATDDADIASGLSKLVPESGAPYYYEPVDVAVHTALTELNWSTDPTATRWLFVIGDAPPFQPGFRETESQAERKYDTELLKRLAVDKHINIYGIICPSREQDRKYHEEVLPECRQFFQELTEGTQGSLLNLTDRSTATEVQRMAEVATAKGLKFPPITAADIQKFANQVTQAENQDKQIIVAVLPFLPRQEMDFDSSNAMVRLAVELREQLDSKGIKTKVLEDIKDAYKVVESSRVKVDDKAFPRKMGTELKARYVIYRDETRPSQGNAIRIAVLNVDSGTEETVSDPIDVQQTANDMKPVNVRLCSQVLQSLATKTKGRGTPVARMFGEGRFVTRLISTTEASSRAVEIARIKLQNSLLKASHNADQTELNEALQALEGVSDMDNDPLWNNLLANASFGLALHAKAQGKSADRKRFLEQAQRYGEQATKHSNDDEYFGDRYFFEQNFAKAIKSYESVLVKSPSVDARVRAHWMLIFLYAGDWTSAAADYKDPVKARNHALALLASYPESLEAQALKNILHWNEQLGRTMFSELPLEELTKN